MARRLAIPVLILASASCTYPKKDDDDVSDVINAVSHRDIDALRDALRQGQSPDAVDDTGHPALVVATGSTQFRAANVLLDAGADIWTADTFGNTPARFAEIATVEPETDEGKARAEFIARLKRAGYPWPPPASQEVRALREADRWPPAPARH